MSSAGCGTPVGTSSWGAPFGVTGGDSILGGVELSFVAGPTGPCVCVGGAELLGNVVVGGGGAGQVEAGGPLPGSFSRGGGSTGLGRGGAVLTESRGTAGSRVLTAAGRGSRVEELAKKREAGSGSGFAGASGGSSVLWAGTELAAQRDAATHCCAEASVFASSLLRLGGRSAMLGLTTGAANAGWAALRATAACAAGTATGNGLESLAALMGAARESLAMFMGAGLDSLAMLIGAGTYSLTALTTSAALGSTPSQAALRGVRSSSGRTW
mmetsp:Transcript_54166/g.126046  ORF Transcript_54166/g.126046 Transcript_54166/m.126046 type:complete len:270 (-) Transcript_54166:97-906(-)